MNTQSLRIKSAANSKEYACQRIFVTGMHPLGGNLECPQMFGLPGADDRLYEVVPLGFNIQITDFNREPKQHSFVVLS